METAKYSKVEAFLLIRHLQAYGDVKIKHTAFRDLAPRAAGVKLYQFLYPAESGSRYPGPFSRENSNSLAET
jgi:hypothetical protein